MSARAAVAHWIEHGGSLAAAATLKGCTRQAANRVWQRIRRERAAGRPGRRPSGRRRRNVRVAGEHVTLWLSDAEHEAFAQAAAGRGGIGPWLGGLLAEHPKRGPLATHLVRLGRTACGIA